MIGVYKITNKITGDYYIGSSKNVKQRWSSHRTPSRWKKNPNKQLYIDMQKYGRDKFIMEVIEELPDADIKALHSREQYYIEKLQPVYNTIAAYTGIDTSDKQQYKQQYQKQHGKQYYIEHADEKKQYRKQYYKQHTDEEKQYKKQYRRQHADEIKQYDNQQCNYNGEILTLNALKSRFWKQGIEHPTKEAKKYLIK